MSGEDPGREIIEGSFTVEQEVHIDAARATVWEAMLHNTDSWWSHRVRKAGGSRIVIEPRVGGRFYEAFDGDGHEGALWGVVTRFEPPGLIRFSGPLGMDLPVSSVYALALEEREDAAATTLRLTHRCIGQIRRNWAEAHERGWTELWDNLKRLVEGGRPWRQ